MNTLIHQVPAFQKPFRRVSFFLSPFLFYKEIRIGQPLGGWFERDDTVLARYVSAAAADDSVFSLHQQFDGSVPFWVTIRMQRPP